MPSSASGETLNERAKRVLGLDLDAWLAIESPDDFSTPATRSEQVAQAQRKHRQRTQSYIQALEQEVLRLRGVEHDLTKQVLRSEAHGSKPKSPAQHEAIDPISLEQAGQSASAPFDSATVDWQGLYDSAPEAQAPCCIKAAENTPLQTPWSPLQRQNIQEPDLAAPQASWSSTVADGVSLNAQVGVNLILKLEAPCLPHLKRAVTSEPVTEGFLETPYNFGTNHVYNLSTRLFHEFTGPDISTSTQKAQTTQITETDLTRLLEASDRLQLANELTPVQVWALVCRLNSVYTFDPSVISLMFEDLARFTYCNSFGTAVSKATVKAAFEYYLGR
ncbi:hypothetical protein BJX66DRAFT_314000 [Aspergillus keveii]|uniref:BZIP transcription factor n=1 Tax=Aspergillus keveii TaxID=714993 RepID=A0ABR4FRQ2_9EURO